MRTEAPDGIMTELGGEQGEEREVSCRKDHQVEDHQWLSLIRRAGSCAGQSQRFFARLIPHFLVVLDRWIVGGSTGRWDWYFFLYYFS
jgi:hypothetical protein